MSHRREGDVFACASSLTGHVGDVLCVSAAQGGSNHLIASGSEDASVRLWDLWSPPAAVAAVEGCFADEAVTSVKWHPFDSERLFASAGTQVLELDRRKLDEPCHCHLITEEEINCVDVHEGGQHLAAADDTGAVHIVDLIGSAPPRQLSKRHANICSAAAFRPQSPVHLASAGLDWLSSATGQTAGSK
eukprot:TRINITY_DN1512_c0_g1_i3.p2 TRINITY_DN1512_c0_g1~~TRINITY_DN1512_c0_g1_i3.p2  ORF type:complete len:189 (-),score=35.80 TRINITY_DN1512_c0_g1_i3:566-1132(-)